MTDTIRKNRFLILRRLLQLSLLLLFGGANWWGWKFLMGDYSSAYVLEAFYLADPHAILQAMAAGFIMSTDALAGGLIVLLFYALVGGRSFCSWVCPVNMITDMATWLRKKINITQDDPIFKIDRKTRYRILALGLLLSALSGIAAFEVINPITMFHRGVIFGFGLGWTLVLAVFLFDLLVTPYGWCGHLCPLGAFYSLTARFALIKVKHDADKCTLCMKCRDVCHEEPVLYFIGEESGYVRGACSNCGRCIEVCDDDALKFSTFNIHFFQIKCFVQINRKSITK